MARLVQGLRCLISHNSSLVRLSVPRMAIQQRCLHSTRLAGLIAPALIRNVQVGLVCMDNCGYISTFIKYTAVVH